MNDQFKEQITYKAREFATAYTNRHFPNEPAFAFGHEGWAKFVVALVELAGAHPDKGTSALSEVDCVPRAWQITYASADGTSRTVVHGHNAIGDYRQIDPAATSVPLYAAPVVPAPVAQLSEPPTDEQMDSIYRDVWTTVPHGKRLFEFGRRVVALAAAPTTPKD